MVALRYEARKKNILSLVARHSAIRPCFVKRLSIVIVVLAGLGLSIFLWENRVVPETGVNHPQADSSVADVGDSNPAVSNSNVLGGSLPPSRLPEPFLATRELPKRASVGIAPPEGNLEALPGERSIESVDRNVRLEAEVTAHMTMDELVRFRALRRKTVVRDIDGHLVFPYAKKGSCPIPDHGDTCNVEIIDSDTQTVVFNGESWAKRFVPTGMGQEIVRLDSEG